MASASASPAELRKEGKRAAPKMAAAYDDPARHSQGRVLADFGRGIGVDLDGAHDMADLQERLDLVHAAWNALPMEERVRRMPDPSPKGAKGINLTHDVNAGQGWVESEPATAEEVALAAQAARSAPFVQQCLALREWLGDSKPVTQAGLLRPAVAREAYQHLDLWPWERGFEAVRFERLDRPPLGPEVDALRAEGALHSWTSAGDCLPLDRLWYSLEMAQLIEVRSTKARPSGDLPTTDDEWARTGLALVAGLATRMGDQVVGALLHVLGHASAGLSSMEQIRSEWVEYLPFAQATPELLEILTEVRTLLLKEALYVFEDAGLWTIDGDRITLTMLGEFIIDPLEALREDGLIGDS